MVAIDKEAFKVVNEEGLLVNEGSIVLSCGVGQPDSRTASITGHHSVVVRL